MSVLDRPVFPVSTATSQALRRLLLLTFTLALVAFAILLPVVQSSDEAAQGYRIRALEQQKNDLDARIYVSQAQIAQLGSLSRIDSEARNRLGMVPATDVVAVTVDASRPSSTPVSAPMQTGTGAISHAPQRSVTSNLLRLLPPFKQRQ